MRRTIASETGMSPGHATAATVAAAAAIRVPLLLRHKCMLHVVTCFLSPSRDRYVSVCLFILFKFETAVVSRCLWFGAFIYVEP